MIYYTEPNFNTEAKQEKILHAKQFLVPPLLTALFCFSRVVFSQNPLQWGIQSSVEYHVMGGGGG